MRRGRRLPELTLDVKEHNRLVDMKESKDSRENGQ